MIWFYRLLQVLFSPLLLAVFVPRFLTQEKYRTGLRERLSLYPDALRRRLEQLDRPVWVHAVSVGELLAARPFLRGFRERFPDVPLVVSTTTLTGQTLARKEYEAEFPVLYFPLDIGWCVSRAYELVRPRMVILMETEIWPEFIWQARQQGVKLVQLNGRLSDKSFPRMQKMRWFFGPLLRCFSAFGMQTDEDCRRIQAIGARPEHLHVTGNFKFEQALQNVEDAESRWAGLYEDLAPLTARQVIVLGSTHPGEDEELLRQAKGWLDGHSELTVVIVPRHPERQDGVVQAARALGINMRRRSTINAGDPIPERLIMLDTMGELAGLFRLADLAVVGGSFIRHGGQNPLEPAVFGVPTICGPSMENFRETKGLLLRAGVLTSVEGVEELSRVVEQFLRGESNLTMAARSGKQAITDARGSVERALNLVADVLQRDIAADARAS